MKDGEFFLVQNIAENKELSFEMPPEVMLAEPDMILHSHTVGHRVFEPGHNPKSPSAADLQGQLMTAVEWGIVVTDGQTCEPPVLWGNPERRPPLLGREFIYNAQDCFSLAQDWYYQEMGKVLPNFVRDPFWHEDGKNYIVEQFENYGFKQIDLAELQYGDALVYCIRSPIPRHIGIYLGNNQVISHWYNRVSAIESFGTWAKYIALALRPVK